MKILAISDFHGKFPSKLLRKIKKEKPDLILSGGDYANADKIRKIIFKNWTNKKWYEAVGLTKAKKIEKESFESGLKILKKLNSLGKKVYITWGNTDFYKSPMFKVEKKINPGFYENKIKNLKNITLTDNKKRKVMGIRVVGHGGYLDVTEFIKNSIDKDKEEQQERLGRYKKSEGRLKKLFLREKPSKNFIFLTHYTPYGIFDKVKLKSSPMYDKHVGFEPYSNIIKHYQPMLVICGHMHEYQGKQRLGKSLVINPGAAQNGKAAIIEIEKERIKSVRFLK
ncbi:hypothetical protein COV15_00230 [Candidatus Woesearchaeota archaeon CG10_big_fil_rev_8_21_14_0_10_34_12]|nr:MAG: hypothetical protein COV15_00230 [Candidatus Woesearchaeota archaeon CG10_big_fil_rev_8_21_14_0_10_34_12]